MTLGESLGVVAPYYNLVLVLIALVLFFKLFSLRNKKIYLLPWKFLYLAVWIYIIEEVLTVLNFSGLLILPRILNAMFEFGIISLFIYLLLLQKEYLKNAK